MIFVTFAFFLASLVIGIAQIVGGQVWPGASFILGGLFAYWSGSSLKLGIFTPHKTRRNVAFLLALAFALAGFAVTWSSGVRFEAFGQDMPGYAWVLAGVLAGLLGTRRRRALAPPKA